MLSGDCPGRLGQPGAPRTTVPLPTSTPTLIVARGAGATLGRAAGQSLFAIVDAVRSCMRQLAAFPTNAAQALQRDSLLRGAEQSGYRGRACETAGLWPSWWDDTGGMAAGRATQGQGGPRHQADCTQP